MVEALQRFGGLFHALLAPVTIARTFASVATARNGWITWDELSSAVFGSALVD